MAAVTAGDWVRIHYIAKTDAGSVFETSENRDPLELVAGGDEVIPGISAAVIGMEIGEQKQVSIPAEQGFGLRNADLEQVVLRSVLPGQVQEGDQMNVTFGDHKLDVWVKSIEEDQVTVDANHPLAGEALVYDIELVDIQNRN